MRLPPSRRLKLTLGLGFGLMFLCLVVTLAANLAASIRYQSLTDDLIDHDYPARQIASTIDQQVLTIDDNGAWYVLSNDPAQQAQLLHTYQQQVQALRATIAQATALADTQTQRNALFDFTLYYFGNGGYLASNQQAFAQKQAHQILTASDSYARSPFLEVVQQDIQVYADAVGVEIQRENATNDTLAAQVRIINIGLGSTTALLGLGIALFITRSTKRLYEQIEEKNEKLIEQNARLESLSTTDPLTELPNHRALLAALVQEVERAHRYSRPCSLLFLDIDHFKALNDGYGHAAGDAVLRGFGAVVKSVARQMDTVGRWGGEEFIVILPETSAEEAQNVAERIRKAVSFHSFEISGGLHLTCSIGVACYPDHACDQDELITAADRAMYGAKRLGRNQVRVLNDAAVMAILNGQTAEGGREETALRGTVEALVTLVEERDASLGHHSQQVSDLTRHLALALGMPQDEAENLALAALLHDIGKVAISDAILQKPGPLTAEEWAQMRRHSVVGAEVLNHIPSLCPLVPIIRAHHERWDGGGYPDGLKAGQIPFSARVIAVTDAYTVMITEQPYQQACTPQAALAELRRCAGTQFDPQMVEALIRLLQDAPWLQALEVAGNA